MKPVRERLEEIALDEDDPDAAAWAQSVLDGKTALREEPRRPPRADGGEGRNSPPPPPDGVTAFNAAIRAAAGRGPHAPLVPVPLEHEGHVS
jgi:hypothetical protein